ncbi:hypothetical protein A1F95_06723 [Pyrenophora tritici-repentis]|nr:hypothetical protein A1F95_06723 [Pyrenophora tritici-repentis]
MLNILEALRSTAYDFIHAGSRFEICHYNFDEHEIGADPNGITYRYLTHYQDPVWRKQPDNNMFQMTKEEWLKLTEHRQTRKKHKRLQGVLDTTTSLPT